MEARFASVKLRPRAGRRSRPHPPRGIEPVAASEAPPAVRETARHRRSGGPQDRALYHCGCGCAFQAEVTASVTCPECGAPQAW
jgi:hypothetical protein